MDWSKVLTALVEWLGSPRLMVMVLLFTTVCLLLPADVAAAVGVTRVLDTARPWLAAAFLLSAVALITKRIFEAVPWIAAHAAHRKLRKKIESRPETEKAVLAMCILRDNPWIDVDSRSEGFAVVRGLSLAGLIERQSPAGATTNYLIVNKVWTILREDPAILTRPGRGPQSDH